MTWVNPVYFWGLLGISVPILIHLWSGRKGKVIAWAATAWLNPQDSQSSRSLKLDHRLLLLVRVLFWIALVLYLVGVWWKGFSGSEEKAVVHGVIPEEQIAAEFRFELNQALENGEKVVWLTEGLPVYEPDRMPTGKFDPEHFQEFLDELSQNKESLHLYLSGNNQELSQPAYWVSSKPILHLSQSSKPNSSGALIQLDSGRFLGIGTNGVLEIREDNLPREPILNSPIQVNLETVENEKQELISASLDAISEVYGLKFLEGNIQESKLIFTSANEIERIENQFVLMVESEAGNAISNPVLQPWEEVLEKGILPELILKKILIHFGVDREFHRLSQAQMSQKFHLIPETKLAKASNSSEWLLLLILALFGLERFLAYRSNQ